MRARTAPISTGIGAVGNYRSRTLLGDSRLPKGADVPDEPPVDPSLAPTAAPLASEGGNALSAFAAALITSQQPQQPAKPELRQRRAALPAQGSLALHDRRV
jgi:hypothetical protein